MEFKMEGLDELLETMEGLSESPLDFFEGDVVTLICPMCEEESDIEILENNEAKCLRCEKVIGLRFVK